MHDDGIERDLADGNERTDRACAVREVTDLHRYAVVNGVDVADMAAARSHEKPPCDADASEDHHVSRYPASAVRILGEFWAHLLALFCRCVLMPMLGPDTRETRAMWALDH